MLVTEVTSPASLKNSVLEVITSSGNPMGELVCSMGPQRANEKVSKLENVKLTASDSVWTVEPCFDYFELIISVSLGKSHGTILLCDEKYANALSCRNVLRPP